MSRDEIKEHAEHILERMRGDSHRIPTKVGGIGVSSCGLDFIWVYAPLKRDTGNRAPPQTVGCIDMLAEGEIEEESAEAEPKEQRWIEDRLPGSKGISCLRLQDGHE